MFIRSYFEYEMSFPKAGIVLPKKRYSPMDANSGKKPFIKVEESVVEKLKEDRVFLSLLNTKKYRITKDLPANDRTKEDLLEEEVATLKKQLKEKENGVN
jgi:hypothetical protein